MSILSKKFHDVAYQLKEPYLKFIKELGERGLSRIFKFPGENFSLWWFSLIAEKSPGKSEVYENLILSLINPGQNKHVNLRKRLSTSWLFTFLKGFYAFFCLIVRVCAIKFTFSGFNTRVSKLNTKKYIIVSSFPCFDKEKAGRGILENTFVPAFSRIITESSPDSYAYICLQGNYGSVNLREPLLQLKSLIDKKPVFFREEFLSLFDVLKILFFYLYFSVVSILSLARVKKLFLFSYNGKKVNVWKMLKPDYYSSFSGTLLLNSLEYIFLFRNIIERLSRNSKIIVVAEMHDWEKAIYIYAKRKRIITIGFQHAHVPELLLNYFNDKGEIGTDNCISYCPLPDYLATVGITTAELFRKYGWPQERVFVWGAQRFEPLKLLKEKECDTKKNFFVCAFSMIRSEAENILLLLKRAFPNYPGYKIILKSHYMLDISSVVNALGLQLDRSIFEYSRDSLDELTIHAQGMIVTGSSSCFYAMASGTQVIIPIFEGRLDLNPLSYITNIPFYVYGAEELRRVCDSIINKTAPEFSKKDFDMVLSRYFYFPNNEIEYLQKIESLARND